MAHIAFIGLGHMGAPMAANLVKAGFQVKGFDLLPQLRDTAACAGVNVGSSARETVIGASVVITMLPAGEHVISVYDEVLSVADQDTLFIDCSTISVEESRIAADNAKTLGKRALDAPVSGGVVGAEKAKLTFMVGGEITDFNEALPILQAMGARVVHCGGSGLGQAAKVCNNMILGVSQIAVAEAFVLGEKLGLSHQALYDVASNASGQCWALTTNCPVPGPVQSSPANNDYQPGFSSALMAKDLGLAKQAVELSGARVTLGLYAQEMYAEFAKKGGANLDFSAIISSMRDQNGSQEN
ncbi:MAG TPA: 3-hydroxyisobutyrate dehydrogenase [Microbacteriaceae bacterium]|nr:3-hydroxyisobutyrate dehydrogenase [Microbacteriaceae bacterium]